MNLFDHFNRPRPPRTRGEGRRIGAVIARAITVAAFVIELIRTLIDLFQLGRLLGWW